MATLLTLWTYEDTSLRGVTDEANVKLTAIAEAGGTVLTVEVKPYVQLMEPGEAETGYYLAQITYQAGSEAAS